MRKITLSCEEIGNNNVTITFNDVSHSPKKVLDQVNKFLKAAGYEYEGSLSIMPTNSSYAITTEQLQSLAPISITNLNDAAYGQRAEYKFNTSSLAKAPTMSPLTVESIRPLTISDLKPTDWNRS